MRILILSNIPPGAVGGAEVQARRLAEQWAAAGHQVTVAGFANTEERAPNLHVTRLSTWRRFRLTRGLSYGLSVFLYLWRTRGQFDVIYCRFLGEAALCASVAKPVLRLRSPIVACPAASGEGGDAAWLRRLPLTKLWVSLLRSHVDRVNVLSPAVARELEELGMDPSRFTEIPNGVCIGEQRRMRTQQGRILMFVGRLAHQKGLDILCRALLEVEARERPLKVVLIGDGPERERLLEQIRADAPAAQIEFRGQMDNRQAVEALRDADAFVLPSRYEGMPGALLEAMAAGLPAIVTRCGPEGIIDISCGWICEPGDASSLTRAVQQMIDSSDEQLFQMGARAREIAAEKYSIEVSAQRYLQLFDSVTSG